MDNLYLLVRDQFPEFVRADYPVFVQFVQAYYKWLDQQGVGKVEDVVDLRKTPAQFVEYFRSQLDVYGLFSHTTPFDPRYLERIKEIYNSKGSEQALTNLLWLVYQAQSTVRYPVQNILRASDGRWDQERFFTVQTTLGTIPSTITEVYIEHSFRDTRVPVSRFEQTSENTVRIYFKSLTNVAIELDQIVKTISGGQVTYAGKVIPSPARIVVEDGGTSWQLGQAIIFPGSVRNTVGRVAEVSTTGEITRVEILEYGYNHNFGQAIVVSPYPNKPLGASFDIDSTLISASPLAYHHEVSIYDYTDGVSESIVGTFSGTSPQSYFLENYAESTYTGVVSFAQEIVDISSTTIPAPSSLTIEEWLASRATLLVEFDVVVKVPGRFADESGQLSNQNIVLQDNYYYQQFSYDIQTDLNPSQYFDLAHTIHPAGMKMFTTYNLVDSFSITPEMDTKFPFVTISQLEVLATSDISDRAITKPRDEQVTIADTEFQSVGKYSTDSISLTESYEAGVTKSPLEQLATSDSNTIQVAKHPSDSVSLVETVTINGDKYYLDSVTITSSDTSSFETVQYNTEGYFAEVYVQTDNVLTLGA